MFHCRISLCSPLPQFFAETNEESQRRGYHRGQCRYSPGDIHKRSESRSTSRSIDAGCPFQERRIGERSCVYPKLREELRLFKRAKLSSETTKRSNLVKRVRLVRFVTEATCSSDRATNANKFCSVAEYQEALKGFKISRVCIQKYRRVSKSVEKSPKVSENLRKSRK